MERSDSGGNRDRAFAVNCEGAVNVAQAAREAGSRLMFLSTDYVFDGSKGSPDNIGKPPHFIQRD